MKLILCLHIITNCNQFCIAIGAYNGSELYLNMHLHLKTTLYYTLVHHEPCTCSY